MIVISSDSENQVSDYEFTVSWMRIISDNNQDNVEDDEMIWNVKSESSSEYLMFEVLESNNNLSLQSQWSSDELISEKKTDFRMHFWFVFKKTEFVSKLMICWTNQV